MQTGEFLLAVDGREVFASLDVSSYFEETAGREITLKVGPNAAGTGAREVAVVPIGNEYALRYFAWIEGNRQRVGDRTGGRVAYVHIPDCNEAGYAAFTRHYFAQTDKEAVIIDVRYNNGGRMPDYIVDCLRREPLCYWHTRAGGDSPAPSLGIFGVKVMLINEMAGSMGDILPWAFRRAGMGPLIGKRTWGGSIGLYTVPHDLVDDGTVTAPNMAFYTPEGSWEIENVGISPDIDVDEDPNASRAGQDVQLEKAIEVTMDLLKKSPPRQRPKSPAYPNYRRDP